MQVAAFLLRSGGTCANYKSCAEAFMPASAGGCQARFSGHGKTEWDTDVGDGDVGGLTRTNSRGPIHNGDPATSLPRLRALILSLPLRTSIQRRLVNTTRPKGKGNEESTPEDPDIAWIRPK